jgi:hypothetical protein
VILARIFEFIFFLLNSLLNLRTDLPAMDFRVASNFASFRAAGFSDSPGRPVFLTSSATPAM